MASQGLCSLDEYELMTDAARLVFGEEPTEPDLGRAGAAPERDLLNEESPSSSLPEWQDALAPRHPARVARVPRA